MRGYQLAPIAIFTYNRPSHIQKTIEALLNNEYSSDSNVIIYSDGPRNELDRKKVDDTRKYIKTIKGFKSLRIIERDSNYGLANNIIDGVTSVINEFERLIVLEDDLLTAPYFLKYMNDGLVLYENEEKIISIHGYLYPITCKLPDTFFIKGANCLGWGTWKRGWDLFEMDGSKLLSKIRSMNKSREFDFDSSYPYMKMLKGQVRGKVGSWAIRWYASAFINEKLTLYPGRSLIYHNGSDGSGTNTGISDEYSCELATTPIVFDSIKIEESKIGRKYFTDCFHTMMKKYHKPRIIRLFIKISKYIFLKEKIKKL